MDGHRAARGREPEGLLPAVRRRCQGDTVDAGPPARVGRFTESEPAIATGGRDHRRQRVDRRRLLTLGHGHPGDGRLQLPDGGRLAAAGRAEGRRVVDPGDLLGGRTGHPHVPDAETAQLGSDIGVGRAGHHPLDQVADLVGGGGRTAESEPAVSVTEPELVVDDDRVVGLAGRGPVVLEVDGEHPYAGVGQHRVLQVGGSASSRCRSIGPLAPAQIHQPAEPSTVTTTSRPAITLVGCCQPKLRSRSSTASPSTPAAAASTRAPKAISR